VTLTNLRRNRQPRPVTTEAGIYSFAFLSTEPVRLEVGMEGFQKANSRAGCGHVASTTGHRRNAGDGTLEEQVTVAAETPQIQLDKSVLEGW